jgi:hypothetical protein
VQTYIENSLAGQFFPDPKPSENHRKSLIARLASSECEASPGITAHAAGVAVAAYTAGQKLIEDMRQEFLKRRAAPDDKPVVSTLSDRRNSAAGRDVLAARKVGLKFVAAMRRKFLARKLATISTASKPAAPLKRAARSRAVHSHAAHGGARKAADDGDGAGPDPNFPDAVYWRADGEAMWRGKPLFAPLPEPRPGYALINANCDCWRRQFSNLFCAKCTPIDWREVPHGVGS